MSPEAIQWLANGDRGLSSNTMFTRCLGVDAERWGPSYPLDPDDLTRCVKLIESVPEVLDNFHAKMSEAGPVWAALAARWDELVRLLDYELPGWRDGQRGNAPRTYDLMKACEKREPQPE